MDGRYQERGKLALWSTGFLLLPVVLRRARLWTAFLNEMKQVWSLMGVILGFGVGLLGLLSASVLYQVLEYLPATAIISSWHPSGENSSS